MADKLTRGVAVLGLGRFGRSLALELMDVGDDVLGIDGDARLVQRLAGRLTHVVEGDTTSEEVLRQLNIGDFDRVVVGMGTDLEASILTASAVLDLGVKQVWAKAISSSHARILAQIGVHHVVRPEHDMGKKVAHLVRGRMLDYIELDDGYAFVRTHAPTAMHGRSLGGLGVRQLYDVTVVGVKPVGGVFTYATAETVLRPGDEIVVSGQQRRVEAFAALT